LTFDAALEAVSARGHEMASLDLPDNGAMAAVFGPLEQIERIVETTDGYAVIANINSYNQAVVGGATAGGREGRRGLRGGRDHGRSHPGQPRLPHVDRRAGASEPLRRCCAGWTSATQAADRGQRDRRVLPADATVDTMVDILGQQIASPVQFVKGLQSLYDAGARVFVEVGPKKALHGFVEDVLGSRHDDVLALFTNHPKTGDVASFNQALCGLYAAGLASGRRQPECQHPCPHLRKPPPQRSSAQPEAVPAASASRHRLLRPAPHWAPSRTR
jgi:acyl transferase domain-containing protein